MIGPCRSLASCRLWCLETGRGSCAHSGRGSVRLPMMRHYLYRPYPSNSKREIQIFRSSIQLKKRICKYVPVRRFCLKRDRTGRNLCTKDFNFPVTFPFFKGISQNERSGTGRDGSRIKSSLFVKFHPCWLLVVQYNI